MGTFDATMYVLHSLFAGMWVGSVLFVTLAILPLARSGTLNASPVNAIANRLTTVSRVSALVLFLTGSHMAALRYTSDTLTGSTRGHLVLSMILLWLVLAATVEIGAKRLTAGTERDKVRDPAREARPLFLVASLAATLLLVVAGLLSAYNLGVL